MVLLRASRLKLLWPTTTIICITDHSERRCRWCYPKQTTDILKGHKLVVMGDIITLTFFCMSMPAKSGHFRKFQSCLTNNFIFHKAMEGTKASTMFYLTQSMGKTGDNMEIVSIGLEERNVFECFMLRETKAEYSHMQERKQTLINPEQL